MGRLASHGVAWYRKKIYIPKKDSGKSIFLQVDGAMSYAMVWLNGQLRPGKKPVATFPAKQAKVIDGGNANILSSVVVQNPKLWGPPPSQKPNLYLAVTHLYINGKAADSYEARFGIRDVAFDPNQGIFVNGERIQIKGVNQHHDLGALGAAFNYRAAERSCF